MIARNQIGGLSFEDLSFHPEEIQQLFQQNYGVTLGSEEAKSIVDKTEGWIAAEDLGRAGISCVVVPHTARSFDARLAPNGKYLYVLASNNAGASNNKVFRSITRPLRLV